MKSWVSVGFFIGVKETERVWYRLLHIASLVNNHATPTRRLRTPSVAKTMIKAKFNAAHLASTLSLSGAANRFVDGLEFPQFMLECLSRMDKRDPLIIIILPRHVVTVGWNLPVVIQTQYRLDMYTWPSLTGFF